MATVRELITKIMFRVDQQGLQRAQRGADSILRTLRRIGQQSPRINVRTDTTQSEQRLNRLRQRIADINNQRIHIRSDGPNGPLGGGAGGAGTGGAGGGFMGALGFGGMSAGAIAAGTLATGVAAAGSAAVSATKQYASFDATMSKVKALTNATDADMKKLTDTAQQLGATTQFSATQSAEAMTYLGMAGWKTEEIIKGMPGLLSLAAASGTDLATTADIVSDDLTAFHMSADKAAHMADVMAVASTNANTNVNLMGMTFKYAGAVAGSLGYSLEDVAIATGLMANAGIKGEMAGTALRSTMTRMIDPPKDAAAALAKLGVSAKNADGSVKPFRQQINELRKSFAKLSKAEQAEAASSIAGLEAMSGFLAVVTASDKDFDKLANAIDHADGAAAKSAATMNDNLLGSMTALGSATEAVALKFGKVFEPAVRKAVNKAKDAMSGLSKTMEDYEKIANARAESKKDGMTTEELDEYRSQNGIDELENQHPIFTEIIGYWSDLCDWIDRAGKFLEEKFGNEIQWIAKLLKTDWFGEWELGQELMKSGLDDLSTAFRNLAPFIEAITPLLQVIIDAIGIALVWVLKTVMLVGATAFRVIAGAIEIASEILNDFGAAVKWVANELEYLINKAVEALQWLGLIEKKQMQLGGENMISGWLKGGGGNTSSVTQNNDFTFNVSSPGQAKSYQQKALEGVMPTLNYGGTAPG